MFESWFNYFKGKGNNGCEERDCAVRVEPFGWTLSRRKLSEDFFASHYYADVPKCVGVVGKDAASSLELAKHIVACMSVGLKSRMIIPEGCSTASSILLRNARNLQSSSESDRDFSAVSELSSVTLERLWAHREVEKLLNPACTGRPPLLVVLDQPADDPEFCSDSYVAKLLSTAQEHDVLVVFTCRDINCVPPSLQTLAEAAVVSGNLGFSQMSTLASLASISRAELGLFAKTVATCSKQADACWVDLAPSFKKDRTAEATTCARPRWLQNVQPIQTGGRDEVCNDDAVHN